MYANSNVLSVGALVRACFANGGEIDGVRVITEDGVKASVLHPVPAAHRNSEAELNYGLPGVVGTSAFVQGGWDAFCERTGTAASKLHGSATYGWGGVRSHTV